MSDAPDEVCLACGAAVPAGCARCPTCRLVHPFRRRLPRGAAVLIAVTLVVLGLAAITVVSMMQNARRKADRTRCASNLRQLGMAAILYADDHRAFPHVGRAATLDGDVTTGDTPRALRLLAWGDYMDRPGAFVCPSADGDLEAGVPGDPRLFTWDGAAKADPTVSPLVDEVDDPPLAITRALSYGWTRRALGSNAPSSHLLLADRAVVGGGGDPAGPLGGNHSDGWSVAHADGSVEWVWTTDPRAARLAATEQPDDGHLAVQAAPGGE